jgi:hypothetical protein
MHLQLGGDDYLYYLYMVFLTKQHNIVRHLEQNKLQEVNPHPCFRAIVLSA